MDSQERANILSNKKLRRSLFGISACAKRFSWEVLQHGSKAFAFCDYSPYMVEMNWMQDTVFSHRESGFQPLTEP